MPNIVKNTTLISLLDLIMPHSCRGCGRIGQVLCNRCKNNLISQRRNFCPKCKAYNQDGDCPHCTSLPPIFVVGERTGLLGELVHDYKYHSIRALTLPLAELLDATLPTISGPVVLVPLPTISKHIRTRGFDHTRLILHSLAKLRGTSYQLSPILIRHKDTVQVGSNRTARLTQAAQAYQLAPHTNISPSTTYILFDDVWTTGASLTAAYKKLQQAGAHKIILAILAVSRLD